MNRSIRFKDVFIPAVLKGNKTITIRSQAGQRYQPGEPLQVVRDSDGERVAMIKVLRVESILFQDLDESHAIREAMSLSALKKLIREIYPDSDNLTMISFKLIQ
ncbi:MAG: N(4)-acetylcytidine aminohydrolase [Marinicella pacifica]